MFNQSPGLGRGFRIACGFPARCPHALLDCCTDMMSRSRFAPAVLLMFSTALFVQAQSGATAPSTTKTTKQSAAMKSSTADWKQVHASAIVVDTHSDTPMRFVDEQFDPGKDAGPHGHWDIEKAKKGNLGVEFFSIWVDPQRYKTGAAHHALDMIDSVHEVVRQHPDDLVFASGTKDIYAARRGTHKRIAVLMGVEGGHAIENDVRILRDYYRLGVRYMTLTWANSNELGQSSGDYKKDEKTGKIIDDGLTDFGRSMVTEMNRLGMIVDISHVSDRSFYNALTMSRAPVIASHSSSRKLTDVPRNMTDEMLQQLARYNGGVVQVNFNCGFISNDYERASKVYLDAHPVESKRIEELSLMPNKTQEQQAELNRLREARVAAVPRPPLSALIDHIDHIAKVAGIDHVGIGSDFDGVDCLPQGIDSVADLPKITEMMMKRGYKAEDMHKILGGNLLRVFAQVEKVAHEIQTEKNPDKREEVKLPPEKK
jgi:membrane dipeptidase